MDKMDKYEEVRKLQESIAKTGGSFKFSVLMQKRLKQIQRSLEVGAQQPDTKDLIRNIMDEIHSGKIELVSEEEFRKSLQEAVKASEREKEKKRTTDKK